MSLSYEGRAQRLSLTLEQISQLSHSSLVTTRELGELRLVIAVNNVSLESLKAKIAEAASGKWIESRLESKLILDTKHVADREAKRVAIKAAGFQAAQETLARAVAKSEPFGVSQATSLLAQLGRVDAAYDAAHGGTIKPEPFLDELAPGQRAMRRVVIGLDPKVLAALPNGTTVFSNRPTKLQRPLGASGDAVIATLGKEQAIWSGVYTGDAAFEQRKTRLAADPRTYHEPIDAATVRCLVRVTSQQFGPVSIQVYFADRSGKVLLFGGTSLNAVPEPLQLTAGDPKSPLVTIPSTAIDCLRAMGLRGGRVMEPQKWRRLFFIQIRMSPWNKKHPLH
jgi:hypothetical protein